MERGERRSRGIAVAGIAVLAIALVLISWQALGRGSASTGAGASAGSTPAAQMLVLRLHDLPLGYRATQGSAEFPLPGIGCAPIEPVNPRPRLAAFLDRYSPVGCLALYGRLFRVPGTGPAPLAAGTGALDVGSIEGAEAGLAVSRELLSHLLGDELPREVPPPETVGDATRLYHWEQGSLFAPDEESSSFLVWRSGSVVASIFVAGGRAAANDRIAVELARRQQAHIEAPTPYTPVEADDTEVALDDPALRVPVYWLGRTFAPGHGLRPLRLLDTISTTRGSPRSARANLLYVDRLSFDPAEGIFLNLWSPRQWKRIASSGRELPVSLNCDTVRGLKLIDGQALIFAGFESDPATCPKRPPRAYTAHLHLGRVVVTVATAKICEVCAEAGTGPYNSFKGMATIARGLEPRIRALSP